MMIIYQLSITNMAFLRKYRRFYLIVKIKKKVKHDLKFLFSLFKKVSSVDDENFLALFFVHFASFWATLSLYPTSTLCFIGVFPNSNI